MSNTNTEIHFATDAQYKHFAAEHETKVKAHARAEVIARQFNEFALDPAPNEPSGSYRRRLAGQFQKYSKDWGKVDLKTCAPDVFDHIAEPKIYADAVQEARAPTDFKPGQMVERVTIDDCGRKIRKFYGDPKAFWQQFTTPALRGR